jgi:hypothetical protein
MHYTYLTNIGYHGEKARAQTLASQWCRSSSARSKLWLPALTLSHLPQGKLKLRAFCLAPTDQDYADGLKQAEHWLLNHDLNLHANLFGFP